MSNKDRDPDEFSDVPPIVPPRDEVESHQQSRGQPDLARPRGNAERVPVSSLPVRIMLGLLALLLAGGASAGYWAYQQAQADLAQANNRIGALEDQLASVDNSTEESTQTITERLDMHFSEIDKLWAARNATNEDVDELTGRVATLENRSEEMRSTLEQTSERATENASLVEETRQAVDTVRSELESTNQQVASLDSTVQELQGTTAELVSLTDSLTSEGEGSTPLQDRIARIEEAIEAIDAYRLQMNQTVRRIQNRVDSLDSGN